MFGSSLNVLSHWATLVENMEASPQEFYAHVRHAVKNREIPDVEVENVTWKEGSFLSADRVYLRVSRGRYLYDICAAPFGTGFFFSSWMAEKTPSPLIGMVAVTILPWVMIISFVFLVYFVGVSGLLLWLSLVFAATVLSFFFLTREDSIFADHIFVLPTIGPFLERVFRPNTYYRDDTQAMFRSLAHSAVLEAVDATTKAKGAREITGDERKPVLRDFFKR